MEELWTMSTKEMDRALVMAKLVERSLSQVAAAEMLRITVRQVRRLQRAYEAQGATALVSKRRGKPSNRKLDDSLRQRAIGLVRERYEDFGPTLAGEQLWSVVAAISCIPSCRSCAAITADVGFLCGRA
jgi:transposase